MPTRCWPARTVEEEVKRLSVTTPLPPDPENTGTFDRYGLPVITVPCGFDRDGMPIGLQIVGPHFAEDRVISVAYAYRQATDWHMRRLPSHIGNQSPGAERRGCHADRRILPVPGPAAVGARQKLQTSRVGRLSKKKFVVYSFKPLGHKLRKTW